MDAKQTEQARQALSIQRSSHSYRTDKTRLLYAIESVARFSRLRIQAG